MPKLTRAELAAMRADTKEAFKHYTTLQLLEIQRECATVSGKARVQMELRRRRDADARAERDRARKKRGDA